jgi:hypothetical protein
MLFKSISEAVELEQAGSGFGRSRIDRKSADKNCSLPERVPLTRTASIDCQFYRSPTAAAMAGVPPRFFLVSDPTDEAAADRPADPQDRRRRETDRASQVAL